METCSNPSIAFCARSRWRRWRIEKPTLRPLMPQARVCVTNDSADPPRADRPSSCPPWHSRPGRRPHRRPRRRRGAPPPRQVRPARGDRGDQPAGGDGTPAPRRSPWSFVVGRGGGILSPSRGEEEEGGGRAAVVVLGAFVAVPAGRSPALAPAPPPPPTRRPTAAVRR